MDFEVDDDQRAWRDEVRAFLRENVTAALIAERRKFGFENAGPELDTFRSAVSAKGWYGINWPTEYGGLGLTATHQHILVNEFAYVGAPGPDLTVTSVAPMIMRYGTDQNRAEFLPPIARGEMTMAVGYSEPNAGTDLAALSTKAELDGDDWVINGSKIWNSRAQISTHEWLCVRTDPDAPKHHGISVMIVPINAPGVEVRPLIGWDDYRTNETFFTDVRVPVGNLIGEVNHGWQYITGALDLERGGFITAGDLRRAVDDLLKLAHRPLADGSRPVDDADVRRALAQVDADVEVAALTGMEISSLLESGQIPTAMLTAGKINSSELRQRVGDLATRMFGLQGVLGGADDLAMNHGQFEKLYRGAPLHRFGGGTNEVLRDVLAQRELAMPKYGR
jgi:alkylation response protein AidB-like acyl-CoA dehydrogenase